MRSRVIGFATAGFICLSLPGCKTSPNAEQQTTNLQSSAGAEVPMLRFWRGFAQDRSAYSQFINLINQKLIPQTITVNAGRGLIGYLPFILPLAKPDYLPDEIAIVAYSSADAYQAIRSTPEGEAYGALHFAPGVFAKLSTSGIPSGSTVAGVWDQVSVPVGDDTKPVAFVFGDQTSWQRRPFLYRTVLTPNGISQEAAKGMLKNWQNSVSASGVVKTAVILIANKYILEVVGGSDGKTLASVAERNDRGIGQVFLSKPYVQMPVQGARANEGSGVNVSF